MRTPSFRVHEEFLEAFDDAVAASEYQDRTKAIRGLIREFVDGNAELDVMPRQPPTEDGLAEAYRKLCLAPVSSETVRHDTPLRVCSGGSENISK